MRGRDGRFVWLLERQLIHSPPPPLLFFYVDGSGLLYGVGIKVVRGLSWKKKKLYCCSKDRYLRQHVLLVVGLYFSSASVSFFFSHINVILVRCSP
jgi:hypothetical protein